MLSEEFTLPERRDDRISKLVEICRSDLMAEEVWLFGSRARGDHGPCSDWDVLAVIRDDAPDEMTDPMTLWNVKKRIDLPLDLLAVKKAEFLSAQDVVTTLSYEVKSEGVRLDG